MTFEAGSSTDIELHHLALIVELVAQLLLHLGQILLVLKEGQNLRMLLIQALHIHQVALDVAPQHLLLLLDLLQLGLGAVALRAALHQHGGATVLHYITVRSGNPTYVRSSCSSERLEQTQVASLPRGCSSPQVFLCAPSQHP